ncbi:MAG: SRPBCC domain-containing protein [Pyrinomonadaceae bacterium]|nr:SRPBCC domain-containing protein [Blastocatellia bacterium]MCW5954993.1 SRPBCC domain-containing protein [Pyrinomonadaceae bacterium]
MELKTKIHAEDGKHDLTITREFDLPVELLFRAHAEAEIFEQWMSHEYGTVKVVKFEARRHGGWEFQTSDAAGNVIFSANGTIHEFIPDAKITRTFEMANSPFDVQLEFLEFERLSDETSKLRMHVVYRSAELRDQMLKLPFASGLNMAHDRLQDIVGNLR